MMLMSLEKRLQQKYIEKNHSSAVSFLPPGRRSSLEEWQSGKKLSSDVIEVSGREESRKARCVSWETGQWKVAIGAWQQVLGRWYACGTDSVLSFGKV